MPSRQLPAASSYPAAADSIHDGAGPGQHEHPTAYLAAELECVLAAILELDQLHGLLHRLGLRLGAG
jgi:hypothetical protein